MIGGGIEAIGFFFSLRQGNGRPSTDGIECIDAEDDDDIDDDDDDDDDEEGRRRRNEGHELEARNFIFADLAIRRSRHHKSYVGAQVSPV